MNTLIPINRKVCKKCNEEKELEQFYVCKSKKDGLYSWCKKCTLAHNAGRRCDNRQRIKSGEYKIPDTKICTKCGKEKEIDKFSIDTGSSQDGHRGQCKQCDQDYTNQWRCDNKEHIAKWGIGYRNTMKNREPGDYKIVERKKCSTCHQERGISEFHKSKYSPDGHEHRCKSCTRNRHRHEGLKKYGLSIDKYLEMFEIQDGECAICGEKETAIDGKTKIIKSLAVDHNHITGVTRELLCQKCNTAIGHADESPELLRTMANYLEKWDK